MRLKILCAAIVLIAIGYPMMKSGGRVVHVSCTRGENALLAVCKTHETFLDLIPVTGERTIPEITTLAKAYGKVIAFKHRGGVANLVSADLQKPSDTVTNLNRLQTYLTEPSNDALNISLANQGGNLYLGTVLLIAGLALLTLARKPSQNEKHKLEFDQM